MTIRESKGSFFSNCNKCGKRLDLRAATLHQAETELEKAGWDLSHNNATEEWGHACPGCLETMPEYC